MSMLSDDHRMIILGITFSLLTLAPKQVYGDCQLGLGMMTGDIRDHQITASSSYSKWTQPFAGRLWNDRRPSDGSFGGWCAMDSDQNPYLQVDFINEKVITSVATQGLDLPSGNWVTRYAVNYSCDGTSWQTYKSHDNNSVLRGNSNDYSVRKNTLDYPIIARALRIRAVDWNPYGIVCIRMELYGCDATQDGGYEDCGVAAGMESREISSEQITASSFMSEHLPSQGRLNNVLKRVNGSTVWGSWCTQTADISQYIQVDLTVVRNISGVATQGSQMGNWVTMYVVNHSVDGLQWMTYHNDSGMEQVFSGNFDEQTVVKNMFVKPMSARFFRINPRAWRTLGQICMRVEIYVCQPYQGCPNSTPLPTKTMAVSSNVTYSNTGKVSIYSTQHTASTTASASVASIVTSVKPPISSEKNVIRERYSDGATIRSDWPAIMAVFCWIMIIVN